MHHLRDEAKERLERRRKGRFSSWALWLRNVVLLLAIALLIRYFGSLTAPSAEPAPSPITEEAVAPPMEDSP